MLGSKIPVGFCKFVILCTGWTVGVIGTGGVIGVVGVVGVVGVIVGVVGVVGITAGVIGCDVPSKHTCLIVSKFAQVTQVFVFKLKYPKQLTH